MDALYTGAATYGRARSVVVAVFVSILGLIMVGAGGYGLLKHPPMDLPAEEGMPPEEMSRAKENASAIFMIVLGLAMLVLPWVVVHFTMKSKAFAAGYGTVEGAGDVLNLVGDLAK